MQARVQKEQTQKVNDELTFLEWKVNYEFTICWAIWENRRIFKFPSEYGPSLKNKLTNNNSYFELQPQRMMTYSTGHIYESVCIAEIFKPNKSLAICMKENRWIVIKYTTFHQYFGSNVTSASMVPR